jgi:uncharacterized protein with FMN-binding domain
MSKSNLYLFAAALAVFGLAILTGHPPWGAVTGISILLTAAAMAFGALAGKKDPRLDAPEPGASSQKISAGLVTLSATAVLAVYAAGYQRTRLAASQFETESTRSRPLAAAAPVIAPALPSAPAAASQPQPAPVKSPRTATASQRPTASAPASAPKSDTAPEPPAVAATEPPALPAPPPSEPAPSPAPKTQTASLKDGTFLGWGRCRHGSIQASVAIEGGQIVKTEIAQCLTRYSCSWIANLPGQVVSRQNANVDLVSGATESTDAFYEAVSSALASAREQ